jgi:hypothetical protein
VAVLLSAYCAYDALKSRRPVLFGPALLSLLGPSLWLAHGFVKHDDAFFFVERVAAYRRSLGRSPESLLSGFLGYPNVLLRAEPELMLASILALFPKSRRSLPRRFGRVLFGACAVLGFLILGDLGDGAPTHHPERPLLVVWLALCLVVGHAVVELLPEKRWLYACGVAALGLFLLRPILTHRDSFIDRGPELAIGNASRHLVGHSKLLVDGDDYAFFAVMAGFRRVASTEALFEHDPRVESVDPWSSRGALSARLRRSGASWLVVAREKLPLLHGLGQVALETERYVLFRIQLPASTEAR